jgi:hypothetical protein
MFDEFVIILFRNIFIFLVSFDKLTIHCLVIHNLNVIDQGDVSRVTAKYLKTSTSCNLIINVEQQTGKSFLSFLSRKRNFKLF